MIIAYLMPQEALEPCEGVGFITCAATEQEALEKLKEQFRGGYEDMNAKFTYTTEDSAQRPHFVVDWEVDGEVGSELYWLHTAEG